MFDSPLLKKCLKRLRGKLWPPICAHFFRDSIANRYCSTCTDQSVSNSFVGWVIVNVQPATKSINHWYVVVGCYFKIVSTDLLKWVLGWWGEHVWFFLLLGYNFIAVVACVSHVSYVIVKTWPINSHIYPFFHALNSLVS